MNHIEMVERPAIKGSKSVTIGAAYLPAILDTATTGKALKITTGSIFEANSIGESLRWHFSPARQLRRRQADEIQYRFRAKRVQYDLYVWLEPVETDREVKENVDAQSSR